MRLRVLLFLIFSQLNFAADKYVAKTGNDSTGDGTIGNPWLTITKAQSTANPGDTFHINVGTYDEAVEFLRGGTAGNPVTYIAEGGTVTFRQARLRDPYITIQGFQFSHATQMSWSAYVRFENDADFCIVQNNRFGPGTYAMSDDFTIDGAANTITSPTVNWETRGFKAGMTFYIGAAGVPGMYGNNHDTLHTVASVSGNTLTTSTDLVPESLNPFWAPIFVGPDRNGISATRFVTSSSAWANNCKILNNTIDDIFGPGLTINGTDHEIANNTLTNNHSYPGLQPFGSNNWYHHNLFLDCPNILWFAPAESAQLTHPEGAGWYDFVSGFIHSASPGVGEGVNNIFEYNWVQNIQNDLAQISENAGGSNFIIRNNVFVGINGSATNGRNGAVWENNTFWKASNRYAGVNVLLGGGNLPDRLQDGLIIKENIFANGGSHWKSTEGAYAITSYVTGTVVLDENFITGFETDGWAPRTIINEPLGVRGGDPVFRDHENPLGPDGLPFTNDDGLRLLPSSPIATKGWGALSTIPVVVGQPFAHFRVINLTGGLGYKDPIGYAYDPTWDDVPPWDRGTLKPWDTPEALGYAPVDVEFSASNSVGGLTSGSVDPTGITNFSWNFGDGSPVVNTASQTVQHTFTTAGSYTVTLTVTNSAAGTDVYNNTYRVRGGSPPTTGGTTYYVATTGNDSNAGTEALPWLTIQHAVNAVSAGDTIEVGEGTFAGFNMESVNGADGFRITINGQGQDTIINSRVIYYREYWTLQNLKFTGDVTSTRESILFSLGAHNCELLDFWLDNQYRLYNPGIKFTTADNAGGGLAGAFSVNQPQNCRISGGDITKIKGQTCLTLSGTSNIVENCFFHDMIVSDFLRMWGQGHIIRDCEFTRNMPAPEGESIGYHADFVQTFGSNGDGSRNHVFERLFIHDNAGQIGQLVEGTATANVLIGTGAIGNWTFRNCIFANMGLGLSNTIPGTKVYNCTFYRTGGVTMGEGDRGSAEGIRIKNNIFFECGDPTRNNSGLGYGFNESITDYELDYNFVCGANGAPKKQSTDGLPHPFLWWEPNGINGGNPGFQNADILDLRLTDTSPLIGEAEARNGEFTTDYTGLVTRGASWDIGAYEFSSEPLPGPPDTPSDLIAILHPDNSVTLTWENVFDESGYNLYRSTTPGIGFTLIATLVTNDTSHTDTGLAFGTTYYYKLDAFNEGGASALTDELSVATWGIPQQITRKHRRRMRLFLE